MFSSFEKRTVEKGLSWHLIAFPVNGSIMVIGRLG